MKTLSQRMLSEQENSYLIFSMPITSRSHMLVRIFLDGNHKLINTPHATHAGNINTSEIITRANNDGSNTINENEGNSNV